MSMVDRVGQVWNAPLGRWTIEKRVLEPYDHYWDWEVQAPDGRRYYVSEEFFQCAVRIQLLAAPVKRSCNEVRCDYTATDDILDEFRDDVDEAALERIAVALDTAYITGWDERAEFDRGYRR